MGEWLGVPHDRRNLWRCSDELLLELFQINVERLLHVVRMPPALVGEALWTRSTLGTCEHLAQLYREFRRRYQARATRKFVQRVLTLYVLWEGPQADVAAPADDHRLEEPEPAPVPLAAGVV